MENKWLTIVGVIVIIIITVGVIVRGPALQEQAQQQKDSMPKQYSTPPAIMLEDGVDYQAIVETNKGDITSDLNGRRGRVEA